LLKQLAILSGKGGTGKTTLTGSFASLAQQTVIADCDVDAPNLHLLLKPKVLDKHEFKASRLAVIDYSKCSKCGEARLSHTACPSCLC